ncbi:MAG: hypothetical protein IJH00_06320 [Erysipelotrichaceae bacterium]|nr:hypothetical protein [Erysipelotrichaceae bacterium]
MMNNKEKHELALMDPYHSIVRTFDAKDDNILVGIKNVSSIPNTLMHKLEKCGFALHTIDRKSQLAGRAVDTGLINPLTGHYMSGSSSGTALNVFAGINDLGIGNDGGGSVLAPAMCVNILGFISRLIEPDREMALKKNTDGMMATYSLGFMAREKDILLKAIKDSTGLEAAETCGKVYSDKRYPNVDSTIIKLRDAFSPRIELTNELKKILSDCDVLILEEGPVDLYGFGDSLFGHFDKETKKIQNESGKGYLRVANTAEATAMVIPTDRLGCAIMLLSESKPDKVSRLLKACEYIPHHKDELIERYFLNIESYRNDGYQI